MLEASTVFGGNSAPAKCGWRKFSQVLGPSRFARRLQQGWKKLLYIDRTSSDAHRRKSGISGDTMRRTALVTLTTILAASVWAGGDLYPAQRGSAPPKTRQFRGIEPSKIGPPAGPVVRQKEAPLPAPYRPVGWGFNCQEFYGPTYYYPWYHNVYEGVNPQYYPFFHPRLWPNYKTDAQYCPGKQCGSSRSLHYWDSQDDWTRDARYGQHQ